MWVGWGTCRGLRDPSVCVPECHISQDTVHEHQTPAPPTWLLCCLLGTPEQRTMFPKREEILWALLTSQGNVENGAEVPGQRRPALPARRQHGTRLPACLPAQ